MEKYKQNTLIPLLAEPLSRIVLNRVDASQRTIASDQYFKTTATTRKRLVCGSFQIYFFFNLYLQLCALNSISYCIQYRERKREINPLVNEIVFPRLFRAQTYDFPEIILPIPFETSFLTLVVVSTRMFRNDSTNRVEKRTRLIYIYTHILSRFIRK